jgi:hypothetical protein
MLKKYQVLIPVWLEDYIKYLAERYDLSFSEIIRAEICYAILCHVSHFFPEFKSGITPDDILGMFIPQEGGDLEREELLRILSKIYFETRKAVEYRLSVETTPKKK